MDPDFGQYWHFCGPFIVVRIDKTHIKGVLIPSLDKDDCIRIGYSLKVITVEDIFVPQKHANCVCL